jgi:hypothetical protein
MKMFNKMRTVLMVALLMNVSLSAFSQDRDISAEEAQAIWESAEIQQMLSFFSQNRAGMSAEEALAWVEENSEKIPQMSRTDVLTLNDVMLQLVLSRKLTPIQRHAFKVEHLNEVLTLDWNEEERAHLMQLYNLIAQSPSLFECDNAAMLENALVVWSERGYEELGWIPYSTIPSILASGVRMSEKVGNPIILHSTLELAFALYSQGIIE